MASTTFSAALRKSTSLFFLSMLLVVLLCGAVVAHAQAVAVAEIDGVVTDPSGKVVPGAQVTAIQTDRNLVRQTTTNNEGRYSMPDLPVGPYQLGVKMAGFKDYRQTGIVLQVGSTVSIDVLMQVGSVAETVEVTANAALVESKDSAIGQVTEQRKILELPLNGRNPVQLLTLVGGGTTAPAGDLTGSKNIQGSQGSQTFSLTGGQANGVNYLLDGGDNNDSFSNVNLPIPFPDALAEFNVQSNALQAQFGLHPGGVVNIVTKSGANAFHGDLFEFLRNYDLNARPKGMVLVNSAGAITSNLQPVRDSLKRSQFGGTAGGKIIRDKLFFFGGYQQTVQRSNPGTRTAHVPTAQTIQGNFSIEDAATTAGGCQSKAISLIDPLTKANFAGNIIPSQRFDPAAIKLLSNYIPVSPDPCGTYLFGQPSNNPDWQIVGKVDYVRSDKQSLFVRYYIYNYTAQAFFDGKNALTSGPNPGNKDESNAVTVGHTYTFSPTLVNSFHVTFDRRADNRGSANNLFGPDTLGIKNTTGGPFAENMADNYMQITVGNYFNIACGTCAPGYFNVNNYQFSDDVNKIAGRHQLAFGFDFRKEQFNSTNNQQANGQWTFSGGSTSGYSGDNLADLLLGHMSGWNQGNALSDYMRQTVFALYAQDTFRVSSRLTLNAGARWEPQQPAVDKQCRGNQFSLPAFLAGTHSSQYPNGPAGLLFGNDSLNTHGCAFTASHWLATSPRLGFVWDPKGEGKQVIRGGFAMMHEATELFYPERWTTNPPYASAITFNNPSIAAPFSNPWNGYVSPTGVPGDPFPGVAIFPTLGTYVSIPPDMHDMYMLQWNLSYQRQIKKTWLASATYVGNRTNHIYGAHEINMPVYSAGATTSNEQARRPLSLLNPTQGQFYQSIVQADDGNWADYHALLLKLEHRGQHYTLLTNYTWSHCISTYDFGGELAGNNYQNPQNRNAEKADCNFDRRHIFNATAVFESPGIGNRFVKAATKDWRLSPIITIYTGQPFTVTTGSDVSLTAVGADRPNVVAGTPALLSGSQLAVNSAPLWFNPAAFAGGCNNATYAGNPSCVPLGSFGNAGRDIFHGPGAINWDMAISRDFHFGERWKTQLRGDFFNIMNHANWNNPATGLTSSTFGQVTTFGDPRLIQVALKVFF